MRQYWQDCGPLYPPAMYRSWCQVPLPTPSPHRRGRRRGIRASVVMVVIAETVATGVMVVSRAPTSNEIHRKASYPLCRPVHRPDLPHLWRRHHRALQISSHQAPPRKNQGTRRRHAVSRDRRRMHHATQHAMFHAIQQLTHAQIVPHKRSRAIASNKPTHATGDQTGRMSVRRPTRQRPSSPLHQLRRHQAHVRHRTRRYNDNARVPNHQRLLHQHRLRRLVVPYRPGVRQRPIVETRKNHPGRRQNRRSAKRTSNRMLIRRATRRTRNPTRMKPTRKRNVDAQSRPCRLMPSQKNAASRRRGCQCDDVAVVVPIH